METTYWLRRSSASLKSAQSAGSGARFIRHDPADRDGLEGMAAGTPAGDLADILPPSIYAGRPKRTAKGTDCG
jgi:hypothetical protein